MKSRRQRIQEHRYHPLTLLVNNMQSLVFCLESTRTIIVIANNEQRIPFCDQPEFKDLYDEIKKSLKKYKSIVGKRRNAAYQMTDEELRLEAMKRLRLEKKEALHNGNLLVHADREFELEKLRKRKPRTQETINKYEEIEVKNNLCMDCPF